MKTALIIALIILVVGALLAGAGWVLLQKYPKDMNTVKDNVQRYGIEETPTSIFIDTIVSRVELRPTEGEEWLVACMDEEDLYHTVELVDGVLTVKQVDKRQWYEHIGIFSNLQALSVTVYLPAQIYDSLYIHSTSGSIEVQEGFTFSNATLKNTSGFITMSSSVAGNLTANNTSGSIAVNGSVGGNLTANNISGSIGVFGGVNGNLELENGSGKIEVKNAKPLDVSIENTSGGIRLEDVVCQGEIEIENTSGSIVLERCDAAAFDLETTSGGIRGSILSAKVFDCHSTSGGVNVPANGEGGTFKAKTISGGINIEIKEAE